MATTTSTTTTKERQVKIKAGECLVLPGNSKITTVLTSSNGISISSPDCPDLADEIESKIVPLECYIIHIVISDKESDNEAHAWEANVKVSGTDGISVNGVFYSYNTGVGDGGDLFIGSMKDWINGHPVLSNLLISCTHAQEGSNRGGIATLCFKTIPKIAETVYIQVSTSIPVWGPNEPYTNARFYAVPYDQYNKHQKCSCSV